MNIKINEEMMYPNIWGMKFILNLITNTKVVKMQWLKKQLKILEKIG